MTTPTISRLHVSCQPSRPLEHIKPLVAKVLLQAWWTAFRRRVRVFVSRKDEDSLRSLMTWWWWCPGSRGNLDGRLALLRTTRPALGKDGPHEFLRVGADRRSWGQRDVHRLVRLALTETPSRPTELPSVSPRTPAPP